MRTTNDTTFAARDDAPRTLVAGHYEIDLARPLGAGGMAVVYRGKDTRTRRDVALKTLRPEYRRNPETRSKFRKEARTMAFLTHPNVARVFDFYEDDEAPWVVLEFVPGRSLKQLLAQRGPFSPEETVLVLEQAAKALDHLHSQGLVHLDVKPQNLIRTPDGVVKLIDFGLAQQSGTTQETVGGSAFGTAAYLAPEQAGGELVVPATDVYALGCVIYELLTGAPPFEGGANGEVKNDLIRAHVEMKPTPPSRARPDLDLPAWVDDAVLWALAKQPTQRYQDCLTFASVFRSGLESAAGLEDAPAATVWRPGVIDTHEIEPEPEERRPGLGARAGASIYRLGGEAARRTIWLQRMLWRAVLAVAVGNLLLAGLLFFNNGEVPGVYASSPRLVTGGHARVATDQLRLRASPGPDGSVLDLLPLGLSVSLVDGPTARGGESWWLVTCAPGGEQETGYVSGDWLTPAKMTGTQRLKSLANDALDGLGLPERLRF
jgi:serine/threonine-protein kinase